MSRKKAQKRHKKAQAGGLLLLVSDFVFYVPFCG
jgi:hypothetical protein